MPDDDKPPEETEVVCAGGVELSQIGAGDGEALKPRAQISWMASYMSQRYGGPMGAAQHEAAFGWYGHGE